MHKILIAFFCFASPILANAIQATSCDVTGPSGAGNYSYSGALNCGFGVVYQGATAYADASTTVGNLNVTASARGFTSTGGDDGCPGCQFLLGAGASAEAQATYDISVSGPQRQGFVEIVPEAYGSSSYMDFGSAQIITPWMTASSFDGVSTNSCHSAVCIFSVTLGEDYVVQLIAQAIAGGDDGNEGVASASIFFFEADGTTPVAFSVSGAQDANTTPEPATMMLFPAALAVIALTAIGRLRTIASGRLDR